MKDQTAASGARWRRLAISLVVGAVIGFAGAHGMMTAIDGGALGTPGGSEIAALCVALVYFLMGIAVAVGAAAPRAGSTFLNVEDADELREQRSTLWPSAVSCMALAGGLAALALSGRGGVLTPGAALAIFLGSCFLATGLSIGVRRVADELMRQLMRDGAAASFYLTFAVLGGWAVLAHLGHIAAPAMLDIVTLFYALTLIGSFWVIGRRGMLIR